MRNKKKKAFKGTRRIASHHTNAEIVRPSQDLKIFSKVFSDSSGLWTTCCEQVERRNRATQRNRPIAVSRLCLQMFKQRDYAK